MSTQPKWQLSGDYFESCNCSVVCPCLVSTAAPLTSKLMVITAAFDSTARSVENPDKLALAVGIQGNTFRDHDMRWDNSGGNGHYAPIHWSN